MRRILLIDDTPEISELLTFALRDRGFDVVAAVFAQDINEMIDEHGAEALVLDCSILDVSEAIFDSVRAHSPHADLPVILISDTPEKADLRLRSRDAQRVFLVPKPFTGAQVARALSELLG